MAKAVITSSERYDRELPSTLTLAADRGLLRFAGPKRAGLIGWRVLRVCTDRAMGDATGTAINTIKFKALPDGHPGLMGGDREHTFAASSSLNLNQLEFGQTLDPGEDLVLDVLNGTAARTAQIRVESELLYGYYASEAPRGGNGAA